MTPKLYKKKQQKISMSNIFIEGKNDLYLCGNQLGDSSSLAVSSPASRREALSEKGNEKCYIKTWVIENNWRKNLELQAAEALGKEGSHPRVVLPKEIVLEGMETHVVYREVQGGTLRDYMYRTVETPDLSEVLYILRAVSEGLRYTHLQGILHRDIKPDNILLEKDDQAPYGFSPVIIDFDCSGKLGDKHNSNVVKGVVIGTPAYISPEQIIGGKNNISSDLYGLGLLIFEMIEGSLPVDGESPQDYLRAHQYHTRKRISQPEISENVKNVVGKMVEINPDKRYPSLVEMVRAFEGAI